jgi:hypothetical protein
LNIVSEIGGDFNRHSVQTNGAYKVSHTFFLGGKNMLYMGARILDFLALAQWVFKGMGFFFGFLR